jgi:hypothetical protein
VYTGCVLCEPHQAMKSTQALFFATEMVVS